MLSAQTWGPEVRAPSHMSKARQCTMCLCAQPRGSRQVGGSLKLQDQGVLLNPQVPGSVKDPVSESKVENNGGVPQCWPVAYTHTHKQACVPTHTHTPKCKSWVQSSLINKVGKYWESYISNQSQSDHFNLQLFMKTKISMVVIWKFQSSNFYFRSGFHFLVSIWNH